jgi:transposase
MVYFNQQHDVPLERTTEILEDLYGQIVSEGTIAEACKRVEQVNQACMEELQATTGTAHFVETGGRFEKKQWWLHVVCTSLLTNYAVYRNRGSKALEEIGIFPMFKGTAVHDSYRSYFQCEAVNNALCNAIICDLIFIQEQYHQAWAEAMQTLLLEIRMPLQRRNRSGTRYYLLWALAHESHAISMAVDEVLFGIRRWMILQ